MNRFQCFIVAVASLCAFPVYADTNIVNDPGFESGVDFSENVGAPSWYVTGISAWNNVEGVVLGLAPRTGNQFAFASDCNFEECVTDPTANALSQTLHTTVGNSYLLSFYYTDNSGPGGEIKVEWNQQVVLDTAMQPNTATNYVQLVVPGLKATSSTTILTFEGKTSDGYWGLDDVSVTAVPEPETYALFLAGLAVVGVFTRRRFGTGST